MLAVFAVLAAALCFATTGTAQALAGVDASPLAIGAARIAIGGGVLALVAVLAGRRDARRRDARVRGAGRPDALRPQTAALVALGAAGVLAYQPLFFLGTRENGVAIGTVVALGSAPIATGLLDAVFRRRLPGARWMLATAIALAGVVLVSGLIGGGGASGALGAGGIAASAGAGMSYAAYAVAGKRLIDRGWTGTASMGAMFGVAAIVSVPLLLASGTAWLVTPHGIALALWLGLVTTAIAYTLFGWGLTRLAATTVATLTLAEPLGATLLGILVLHERLSVTAAIGLVAIAVGIAIVSMPARPAGAVDARDGEVGDVAASA